MSKIPPQLSELSLEAFQQLNLFTKHYKLLAARTIRAEAKINSRTADYNRRQQTEQENFIT